MSQTIVFDPERIVSRPEPFVAEIQNMLSGIKTMACRLANIVLETGKIVSGIRKMVRFAKNIPCGIATIVCATHTIFTTPETMVTASKKMVSIAPTMACKVLFIVYMIVEHSFANPRWLFLELQPARAIVNSG